MKLGRTDLSAEVFSHFAENEGLLKYLSNNEIDSLIGGIYNSSKGDQKKNKPSSKNSGKIHT